MIFLLGLLITFSAVSAQTFKTSCSPALQKVIETSAFAKDLSQGSQLQAYDCLSFNPPVPDSWVAIVIVLQVSVGTEAHLLLADQKNLSSAANLLARSEPLGLDAFPVWIDGALRLGFVMPKVEHDRVGIYVNLQTAPAVTRVSRWDLEIKNKTFYEVINRAWTMDAGVQPKIYNDNGVWRALIQQRAVEL